MRKVSGKNAGKPALKFFQRGFLNLRGTDESQTAGSNPRTGRKKKIVRAASVLACIVAFTTTYALILPAVTLERQPVCGQEEHIHTDACYAYLDANGATVDPAEVAALSAAGDPDTDAESTEATLSSGSRGGYFEGVESNVKTEMGADGIADDSRAADQAGDRVADVSVEASTESPGNPTQGLFELTDGDDSPVAVQAGDAGATSDMNAAKSEAADAADTANAGSAVDAVTDPADTPMPDATTDASGIENTDATGNPVTDSAALAKNAGTDASSPENPETTGTPDATENPGSNPAADGSESPATDSESETTTPSVADTAQSVRRVLICGQEEHQHTVECYPSKSESNSSGFLKKISPKSVLTGLFGYDHSQSVTVDGTTITAEYNDGILPDDVTMQAVPVSADAYVGAVAGAVGRENTEIKTFDITFLCGDQEIEPSGEVKITFQADFIDPTTDPAIVHITDDGSADRMDAKISDDTITLKTDSFSVYAISYTVDFHYEVDGKTYDFSMPGGEFVSLTDLVEVLGIAESDKNDTDEAGIDGTEVAEANAADDADDAVLTLDGIEISEETRRFVEVVEKVEFSSPDLVWVGKVEEDTTVGQLKDEQKLAVEHSAELTEEQIDQINGASVSGGDWVLISLKAFDTEESLAVTMRTGEQIVVKVSDAQLKKTVISATDETYEITVTYGEDAQIPKGAELKVEEILPGDERYEEYFRKSLEKVGAAEDKPVVESIKDTLSDMIDAITGEDEDTATEEAEAQTDSYAHIFDIEIWADGQKIEPAANASVNIELLDASENMFADLQVVHFGKDGLEVMELTGSNEETKDGGTELNFVTDEFSVYAVVSTNNNNGYNLGGQKFAIINTNFNEAVLGKTNDRGRVAASSVTPTEDNGSRYVVADEITLWEFVSMGGNTYNIKAPDGRFLNITGSGTATLSSNAQNITVSSNGNGLVLYGNNLYLNAWNQSVDDGFGGYSQIDNGGRFTLYSVNEIVQSKADKISLTDLVNAQDTAVTANGDVIIYTRIINEARDGYDYFAVKSDGSLVPVYDIGDTVGWTSSESDEDDLKWKLTVHKDDEGARNGYFDFQNEKNGKYLIPSAEGGVKEDDPADNRDLGVNMTGWKSDGTGSYGSAIERWESGSRQYVGYTIDYTNKKIVPTSDDAQKAEFLFAYIKPQEDTQTLHTVPTLDGKTKGITVKMYDFSGTLYSGSGLPRSGEMTNVMGAGSIGSTNVDGIGYANRGLVSQTLATTGAHEGFPYATQTNRYLDELFNSNHQVYSEDKTSNIFVKQIYDETGYFSYDSSENYAYLSNNGFLLYRELAAPKMEANNWTPSGQKGNFFPFDSLEDLARYNKVYTNGISVKYDGDLQPLTPDDPRYGQKLYIIDEGSTNNYKSYFFGMTMEADFYQGPNGKDEKGNDIIYEFNGDDDMWLYIDNRLVLDIGGCHGAVSGTINFSTGEVHVNGSKEQVHTTLKAMFKNARQLPDGSPWSDAEAEKWFSGDTFADYTKHSFKMFYMERGAYASNLKMTFNLLTLEQGSFVLEKKLPDDVQSSYGDQVFAYQIFTVDAHDANPQLYTGIAGRPVKNEQTGADVTETNNYKASDGNTYDHVYLLKPGESIVVPMADNDVRYYVREIGIDSGLYKIVKANDNVLQDTEQNPAVNPDDDLTMATTDIDAVKTRSRVIYENVPMETYNLRLEKLIQGPVRSPDDSFRFDVQLEDSSTGQLAPYYMGQYYIVKTDENGVDQYYKYENGKLVQSNEPVAYKAGTTGSIDHIFPGYTILITGLLPGTDFNVTENQTTGEYPKGYQYVKTGVENAGTAGIEGSQGTIKAKDSEETYKDAKVNITNTSDLKTDIEVQKIWAGENNQGGESTIVLYKVVGQKANPDDGKPSSKIRVLIQATPAPVTTNDGRITVRYTGTKANGDEDSGSFTLSNIDGWSHLYEFERGGNYSFTYTADGSLVKSVTPTKSENIKESCTIDLITEVAALQKYTYTFSVPADKRPEKGGINVTFNGAVGTADSSNNWTVDFKVVQGTAVSYNAAPDGKFVSAVTLNPETASPANGNVDITMTPTAEPLTMTVPISVDWSGSTTTVPSDTKVTVTITGNGQTKNVELTSEDLNDGKWKKTISLDRLDANGNMITYSVEAKVNSPYENISLSLAGIPITISDSASIEATGRAASKGVVKVTVLRAYVWDETKVQYNEFESLPVKEFAPGSTIVVTVNRSYDSGQTVKYFASDGQTGTVPRKTTASSGYYDEQFEITLPSTPGDYRIVVHDSWGQNAGHLVSVAEKASSRSPAPKSKRGAFKSSLLGDAQNSSAIPMHIASTEKVFYDEAVDNATGNLPFQTILYKDLPAGAVKVEEITLTNTTSKKWEDLSTIDENGNPIYYYIVEKSAKAKAESMSVAYKYHYREDGTIEKVEITNTAVVIEAPDTADITLQKIGKDSNGLSGAVFQLKSVNDPEESDVTGVEGISTVTKVVDREVKTFSSSFETTGNVQTLSGLTDGTYRLYEVHVPAGYVCTFRYIEFTIQNQQMTNVHTDNNDNSKLDTTANNIDLIITNEPGAALPSTGGSGTTLFTILGSILVMLSGIGLILWRRRRFMGAR